METGLLIVISVSNVMTVMTATTTVALTRVGTLSAVMEYETISRKSVMDEILLAKVVRRTTTEWLEPSHAFQTALFHIPNVATDDLRADNNKIVRFII